MNTGPDWPAVLQLQGICAAIYDTIIPRRERIAVEVMKLLMNKSFAPEARQKGCAQLVRDAIWWTDQIIAELDKEQKG